MRWNRSSKDTMDVGWIWESVYYGQKHLNYDNRTWPVCDLSLLEIIALSAVQSFWRILIQYPLTPQQFLVQQRSLASLAAIFCDPCYSNALLSSYSSVASHIWLQWTLWNSQFCIVLLIHVNTVHYLWNEVPGGTFSLQK